MDYGYKAEGGLDFPTKKLRVLTFSPPDIYVPDDGHGLGNGPLPRLVIAELFVDELSPDQEARRMDVEATKERGGGTSTWELRNDASETAAERKKKIRAN